MNPVFGEYGEGIRGDVLVVVEDSSKPEIELSSTIELIYGDAIREQAKRILATFGNPMVRLVLQDSGALPFAVEARIEAALCHVLGINLPAVEVKTKEPKRERLRRTRLYVPGNTPKFFANCALLQPDAVVFDLEDSVALDAKIAARALVRRALIEFDCGNAEVMVRVNPGELGIDDLRALANGSVQAFCIPKTESPEELHAISCLLDELQSSALLIPIFESGLGIERCFEVCRSSPRIVAAAIGLEDYITSIGAQRTPSQLESAYGQSRLVNAARAAGVVPLGSVFADFTNHNGLRVFVSDSRARGFEGVACIHPSQIDIVHQAFLPSFDELTSAQRIVDEFEATSDHAKGVVNVDGRMVDRPVYDRAKRLLAMAEGPE